MAGIVNEAYTLDVNVQEGGAAEATVNVRAWNTDDVSVLDKTTDMNGNITSTVLIAEEHALQELLLSLPTSLTPLTYALLNGHCKFLISRLT